MSRIMQEKIEVPDGVEAKVEGKRVEVSGKKGKLSREFDLPGLGIKADGRVITLEIASPRRRNRAALGAVRAHLLNMIKGVTEGFVYKLRTVYSHFPITVKVEGKRVMIHNFLGERSPRVAEIVGDVAVEVKGDEIIVSGINKEEVGQTAFNIEQATSVKYRDRRIFQDGCYIAERS
ncbi:MAG: 50S ribosomal protein L6 [Candidatus Hadarchaeum sp.]|uniref:50S ribosomal protein L6 n=1 Tax=Candidatus Hadarchaeum sp. TaxID=2883567 RepID=UPI003D1158A1